MLWGTHASRPLKLFPIQDVWGARIGAVVVSALSAAWSGELTHRIR
jgi:hypothetical protein